MLKEWFREWIVEDWKFKLVSLVLAVFLWLFVMGQKSLEVTLSVPLEIANPPEVYQLVAESLPASVRVTVKGPRERVTNLDTSLLKVRLSLASARKGINDYLLEPWQVQNLPRGVEVMDITPSRIQVALKDLHPVKKNH